MQLPKRAFVFLRHGETIYNLEGRLQGRVDVPLNETGSAQAEAAVELLKSQPISRIVSSPAIRVLQTVRPFAEASGIPVQFDSGLLEYFVGSFEGKRISEIHETHKLEGPASWLSVMPDDAEVWPEFVSRVCSAVSNWTEQYSDETILISAHGLVFYALAESLTGTEMISRNAEPHYFSPTDNGWTVTPLAKA